MRTILNSTINMLKSKLILLIIPLFFSCSENIKTTQKPLNVVWISCEDMGPILGSYGNDTMAFFMENTPTAILATPLKYMHTTVEMAHKKDVKACIKLFVKFLQNLTPADIDKINNK